MYPITLSYNSIPCRENYITLGKMAKYTASPLLKKKLVDS